MHTLIRPLVHYISTTFLSIIPYVERWRSCLSLWTSSVTFCGCPVLMAKVIAFDCIASWRIPMTAGKDSPHKYSRINVPWPCSLILDDASGAAGVLGFSTRSAQLLSPHYPLWTRTEIISFSVSLSPHLPPPSPSCIIYHPCLFLSFRLPESTSISVLFLVPLSTSSPPSLDWLFLWRLLLGDTACRTWFCGSGLLTATGRRRQVWQGWGSQSGK